MAQTLCALTYPGNHDWVSSDSGARLMKFPPASRGTFQRTFEDFAFDLGVPGDFVTITREPLGSKVHLSESPASTPSTSTTVDGTVVRSESDRSTALTSLDSIVLTTILPRGKKAKLRVYMGQQVGQHVGSKVKYDHVVGQHVGRLMTDVLPKIVARQLRALEMLQGDIRVGKVLGSEGDYVVPSQTGNGFYRVHVPADPNAAETCSCPDFEERQAPCKHIHLVRLDQRTEEESPSPSGYGQTPPPAAQPKRNWAIYNESQTEEVPVCSTPYSGTSQSDSLSHRLILIGQAGSPFPYETRPSAASSGPSSGSRFVALTASGPRPRRTGCCPIPRSGPFHPDFSAGQTSQRGCTTCSRGQPSL